MGAALRSCIAANIPRTSTAVGTIRLQPALKDNPHLDPWVPVGSQWQVQVLGSRREYAMIVFLNLINHDNPSNGVQLMPEHAQNA